MQRKCMIGRKANPVLFAYGSKGEKFLRALGFKDSDESEGGTLTRVGSQVSPLDCTGCELCVRICPADALFFEPTEKAVALESANWEYAISVPVHGEEIDKTTVKGSQFQQPLL
eukprot:639211-Rhodomonas_salina.6